MQAHHLFALAKHLFYIRALWQSGLSARVPKCQKKIKTDGIDQYSAKCFGRLIFATVRKIVGLKGLTGGFLSFLFVFICQNATVDI